MEVPSVRLSRCRLSSKSLMSDSLRREVVEGGDKWSVEAMVEADSVSTYIPRRWRGQVEAGRGREKHEKSDDSPKCR